jgi:hypothetical protein
VAKDLPFRPSPHDAVSDTLSGTCVVLGRREPIRPLTEVARKARISHGGKRASAISKRLRRLAGGRIRIWKGSSLSRRVGLDPNTPKGALRPESASTTVRCALSSQVKKSPVTATRSGFRSFAMAGEPADLVRGHECADVEIGKLDDPKSFKGVRQAAQRDPLIRRLQV